MAIVQISRIQHRRGHSDNLPQLASAEFGWTINNRKLYIGNGTAEEGAPTLGNTEILTEYSDILALKEAYQYKGLEAGYQVRTGLDENNPVFRTLQNRLDERVSVKEFGAKGDNVTDDTDAINRALYELFVRESNTETRRTLYFPAGTYLIGNPINPQNESDYFIKIPSYAAIVGDGMDCTFIKQVRVQAMFIGSSRPNYVAWLANNAQEIDVVNGASGVPMFQNVSDITFVNDTNTSTAIVGTKAAKNVTFSRVGFRGNKDQTSGSIPAGGIIGFTAESTPANKTNNIVFDSCAFTNAHYGILADHDMSGIRITNSLFDHLYRGINVGEGTTGSGAAIDGPRGFVVTGSLFDNITSCGIFADSHIKKFVSAHNYFKNVGNGGGLNGLNSPDTAIIEFHNDDNYSIGDVFDRPIEATYGDIDHVCIKSVNTGTGGSYAVYGITEAGIQYGSLRQQAGRTMTLVNGATILPTDIVLETDKNVHTAIIDYQIIRGNKTRVGTLKVVNTKNTPASFREDYAESKGPGGSDGSVGITFDINHESANGKTTVVYSSEMRLSPETNALLKYSIRYLD